MGSALSVAQEFSLIIVGALIFVASFLWKDLISDIEDEYFPKNFGLTGRIIYTLVITIIIISSAITIKNTVPANNRRGSLVFDDSPIDDNGTNIDVSDT